MRASEFMQLALDEAQIAATLNEVPIGAVLVCDDAVIAAAHNLCEAKHDPTCHAEMQVIREVSALRKNWRLNDCTLYVTIEPCPMCLGALFQARVGALVYGAPDPKRVVGAGLPRPQIQGESSTGGVTPPLQLSVFPSLQDVHELTDNNHTIKITGGVLEKECGAVMKDFFKMRRGDS